MAEETISRKRIPIPLRVRWNDFRGRVLPVVVVGSVIAFVVVELRKFDSGGMVGVAQGVRSVITSPQLALLSELNVRPYQWVQAGQPLMTLVPADPRASLDLLQSELQLARLRIEPSLAEQNAIDFERLRVDYLRLQQEIIAAEVNLTRAETALRRNTLMRSEKLIPEDTYEYSLRDRDLYKSEVEQKRQAAEQIKKRLEELRAMGEPGGAPSNSVAPSSMLAELELKALQARTNWAPLTLRAPISGMVQLIHRQPGEFVTDSEPLLTVCSSRSDHIVGFLRQPYAIEPELGMKVEVTTRTRQRQRFRAEVSQIGAQVETITNSLAYMRPGVLVDVGLPIIIGVPPHVNIRPGEAVDIVFLPRDARVAPEHDEAPPQLSEVN